VRDPRDPRDRKLAELTGDANWRVRDAAAWALGRVGEADQVAALAALLADPEGKVASRADGALDELSARLDRPREELIAEALNPQNEEPGDGDAEAAPEPATSQEPEATGSAATAPEQ